LEFAILVNFGLLLATMQHAGELVQGVDGAHRVGLDATVVEIGRVPGEVEGGRGVLREGALPRPLYASAHEPAASGF
jgi:hypothetical protein